MKNFVSSVLVIFLTAVMGLYAVFCPYNKVEESFNTQAMHDLWFHQLNLTNYDHFEYPGVVPRTFLGPIGVVLSSSPLLTALDALDASRISYQLVCRIVLGFFVAYSAIKIANATQQNNTTKVFFALLNASSFYYMFYATRTLPNTFALIFVQLAVAAWLGGDLRAFLWRAGISVCVFRVETALLLGPLYLISLLNARNCSRVFRILVTTALYGGIIVLANVAVDTYFWNSDGEWNLMWPELAVFRFNAVENKSHLWGTKPFFWYMYNVLPRFCVASIGLVPFVFISRLVLSVPTFLSNLFATKKEKKQSFDEKESAPVKSMFAVLNFDNAIATRLDGRTEFLCFSAGLFVLAYSFLPHKELRFVIYVVPIINRLLSILCTRIWHVKVSFSRQLAQDLVANPLGGAGKLPASSSSSVDQRVLFEEEEDEDSAKKKKSVKPQEPAAARLIRTSLRVFVLLLLSINFFYSIVSLRVSSLNYPGGVAIAQFHDLVGDRRVRNTEQFPRINVHIDVFCAQSGISRFTQLRSNWIYDKTESLNLTIDSTAFDKYTHLLIGIDDAEKDGSLPLLLQRFDVLSTIDGFDSLRLRLSAEDRGLLLDSLAGLRFWRALDSIIVQRPKVHILQNKKLAYDLTE